MALSQNSTILYSDISAVYDSFNTFITNFGGTITTLTKPGINNPI